MQHRGSLQVAGVGAMAPNVAPIVHLPALQPMGLSPLLAMVPVGLLVFMVETMVFMVVPVVLLVVETVVFMVLSVVLLVMSSMVLPMLLVMVRVVLLVVAAVAVCCRQ